MYLIVVAGLRHVHLHNPGIPEASQLSPGILKVCYDAMAFVKRKVVKMTSFPFCHCNCSKVITPGITNITAIARLAKIKK